MKYIKSGELKNYPLNCPDLERFKLRRLFRKFNWTYIPFTLRFYDALFLREGITKQNKALIDYCSHKGITTFVVCEGAYTGERKNDFIPPRHLPLKADYFLVREEEKEYWLEKGCPKEKLMLFRPQKETQDYKGVVFLHPIYTRADFIHKFNMMNETSLICKNTIVMQTIYKLLKEDVVFKPHPKNRDLVEQFIPKHRLVWGKAKDLIRRYQKVYCFCDSSIRLDCELLGKVCEIIE